MKKLLKDVPIYGGVKDKVEGCSHPVQHGDDFSISPSIRIKCLATPWYVDFCLVNLL
jgi:hydroxyacylglutathione hydrolase